MKKLSLLFTLCALACAHAEAPSTQAGGAGAALPPPTRTELGNYPLTLAPDVLVNQPVLAERGQELRAALAKALADEGFQVAIRAPQPGDLLAQISIDSTAWTSVSPSSLYVVVTLKRDGAPVDQAEEQRINEGFPEKERVGELARKLAHSLASSPRTADFLRTGGAMPAAPRLPAEVPPQPPPEAPR